MTTPLERVREDVRYMNDVPPRTPDTALIDCGDGDPLYSVTAGDLRKLLALADIACELVTPRNPPRDWKDVDTDLRAAVAALTTDNAEASRGE